MTKEWNIIKPEENRGSEVAEGIRIKPEQNKITIRQK